MRIAIIGASGYLGSNIKTVVETHYPSANVFLYDRKGADDGRIAHLAIDFSSREEYTRIDFDVEIIFFFLGKTGTKAGYIVPDEYIDVNERYLLYSLDEYCKQGSKARFVFPSTRLIYKGKIGPIDEESEKQFNTVYAMNKFAGEQYVEQYSRLFGVRYSIFRICVPYGTLSLVQPRYGTIDYMLEQIRLDGEICLYGDGTARRTFTHVEDVCNLMLKGALDDFCEGGVYNIGGEEYSLSDVAHLIANKYSGAVRYEPYPKIDGLIESGDTVFSDAKLMSILHYTYRHTLLEWLRTI